MARQQIDNEDELKRKQRRRLIGAVALFTALVVIVPMVLDNEPQRRNMDIDLRIPDREQAGEFKSQMVLPESIDTAASEPLAASAPAEAASAAVAAPVVAQAAPAEAVQPAQQHGKPPKPERKPEHKPAKPEHKPVQPKEGFAVQVGAFANVQTAVELRDKLRKQGLSAYTEKAGNTTRVRVGAFPTREAAEKVLRKLEAQGMHPAVVNAAS